MAGSRLDSDSLLRAAASNHRAWFQRLAQAAGGRSERFGGIELVLAGRRGTIPFPRSRSPVADVVARIRELDLHEVGCWSLRGDRALGTALVARGFGWGWQPHWMALDLALTPGDDLQHEVVDAEPPWAADLPYASSKREPSATRHLAVRRDGDVVGHVVVNPWRGVAGIYDMGVADSVRGQGIGRALTIAACRAASDLGCTHATLNATPLGERVYRRAGFESLGLGQTWWLPRVGPPTTRQTALAEAIGFGDVAALAALQLRADELEGAWPNGMTPMQMAVVTHRVDVAVWLLDRLPRLVEQRFPSRSETLLHLAVEDRDLELVRLALDRGADREARDRAWNSTPLGWAEHLGHTELAEVLRAST